LNINPKVVICRISGFGQTGPYSKLAGHDMNYIGLSGYLYTLQNRSEKINFPGNIVADFAGGSILGLLGILTALY